MEKERLYEETEAVEETGAEAIELAPEETRPLTTVEKVGIAAGATVMVVGTVKVVKAAVNLTVRGVKAIGDFFKRKKGKIIEGECEETDTDEEVEVEEISDSEE
jgi:hypothetical protein